MAIETRMRVVCDRCAAAVEWWEPMAATYEHKWSGDVTAPDGWRQRPYPGGWREPEDLCPECVAKDEASISEP